MPTTLPLPYDLPPYGETLRHHGAAIRIDGWTSPLIQREIPKSPYCDAIGPWPYATLPYDVRANQRLHTSLADHRFISFSACARPDQHIEPSVWNQADFEVVMLKPHYVRRPHLEAPIISAKTRANLSKARRYWQIEIGPVDAELLRQIAGWHNTLNIRKNMSRFTSLPPDHFTRLAAMKSCQAVVARDADGPGAAMLVMITHDQIHCHALTGAPHAYTQRGFYALYDALISRWSTTHTIYLGGTPNGPDGPGIERFKRRFANAVVPIHMVRSILDPEVCHQLSQTHGDPHWFPPYRSRHE